MGWPNRDLGQGREGVKAFELQRLILSDYICAEKIYHEAVIAAMKKPKNSKGRKKC